MDLCNSSRMNKARESRNHFRLISRRSTLNSDPACNIQLNTIHSTAFTSEHLTNSATKIPLSKRASCPFYYELDIDYRRFPIEVLKATCINHKQQCPSCKTRDFRCEPVTQHRTFLKMCRIDYETGQVFYKSYQEKVQTACVCALRNIPL